MAGGGYFSRTVSTARSACRSAPGVGLRAVVRLGLARLHLALRRLLRHKRERLPGRPREELIGAPRVHDAIGGNIALGGAVAPIGLPLELPGRVGVGVDAEVATH